MIAGDWWLSRDFFDWFSRERCLLMFGEGGAVLWLDEATGLLCMGGEL